MTPDMRARAAAIAAAAPPLTATQRDQLTVLLRPAAPKQAAA